MAAFEPPVNRQQLFAEHGIASVRRFQNVEDPALTGLLLEIGDMGAYEAFMSGPEAESSKSEDGVEDATLRVFAEVK
jgi:hypothetical protein